MPARHVIIGSGIAGLSAAEAIREADPVAEITMISEEPHEFYSRPGLAYLLRGDVPDRQLFIRTPTDVRALRIQRIHGRVETILAGDHTLRLANGRQIAFDRLLLATGALASAPSFPGGTLAGVVKLDSLDDARKILRECGRFRSAVVVGGGITALELAEGLRARGMRTHFFLRGRRYWSDVLDEAESDIVLDRLRHEGVRMHLETQVRQAVGSRGRLTAVETEGGVVVPCQMLAVAIGVRPRIDLARNTGLTVDRGVVVDEQLRTSAPDIFAAGDVAQVRDPRTGVAALDVLWPIALRQGQVAGANMAGAGRTYLKEVPFNVTLLAGLRVSIIGAVGGGTNDDLVAITRGESEAWRMMPESWAVSHGDAVNRVRLMVGGRQIVGALVMGDQSWSHRLHDLIAEQVDISPVRGALVAGGDASLEHLARFIRDRDRTAGRRPRERDIP